MTHITSISGSGGRPWASIKWKVEKSSTFNYAVDTRKIQEFLDSYDSIDKAVIVPISLFPPNPPGMETLYEFSLTLTNFLGGSSSSFVPLIQSSNPNIPNVVILGPSFFQIRVDEYLNIVALGSVSSCATSSLLTYSFKVFKSSIYDPNLQSESKDTRRFVLSPWKLTIDETYQIQVTATSVTGDTSQFISQVYIMRGNVKAVISGALSRQVRIDSELV